MMTVFKRVKDDGAVQILEVFHPQVNSGMRQRLETRWDLPDGSRLSHIEWLSGSKLDILFSEGGWIKE